MTSRGVLFLFAILLLTPQTPAQAAESTARPGAGATVTTNLLPSDWNPKLAADQVMAGLVKISAPQVKGAHDAEFVCLGDRAYVVSIANEVKAGENPEWAFLYASLSIVNLKTLAVETILPIAKSGQAFENETLPTGSCFVPRILQKDAHTVRCYFAGEDPGKRQSQLWFIDFDIKSLTFEKRIHKVKLQTASGTFDMQPQPFYEDAVKHGFAHPPKDYGMYLFDMFQAADGKTYAALNNYPGGQNALAVANDELDTFRILGHYNEPFDLKLTESAVNQLPDGSWLAICRQEGGNHNYIFTTSPDGKTWSRGTHRDFVQNGSNSKPSFNLFKGVYYLGWQEATKINSVNRSVFNIDVSRDGKNWQRKYHFETEKSFQYPSFHLHGDTIWLSVTQGDTDVSRKERIMFGKLEKID